MSVGWQRELSSPQERLSSLYLSQRLSDLTLTFHGSDTTLQVHKVVLAMSSPVFEKKLFCSAKVRERLVLPPDESPKAFKWLLKHLYCGTKKFQDYHQAVDVYTLAQKYEIESLVKLCKKYLEDTLNVVSLPSVYNLAVLHDDSHLLDTCVSFFLRAYPNILNTSSFIRLSYRSLSHLLKQDLGLASHLHLFEALRAWGAAEMAATSLTEDLQKQVRWAIEDFLPCIDFLSFTVNEFVSHVLPTGVFTDEEFCTILANIRSPNSLPMPEVITGGKVVHVGGNSCQHSQRKLGERYRNQLDEDYENQLDERYTNGMDGHHGDGIIERARKQVTVKVKWEVGTKRATLKSMRQRTLFSLSVLHTISVTMLRMNWKVKETDKLQTITVSGRRGKEVGIAIMDGNRAKFHDPLLLKPGVEYEVVLKNNNNNGSNSPDDTTKACESSGINSGISESTSGLFGNILGSAGNTAGLPGNTSGLFGNTTGLFGNTTGLPGNTSGFSGNTTVGSGLFGNTTGLPGLAGNTTGLPGNTTGLPGNTSGFSGNISGTSGYFSNTSSGLFKNTTGISHPSGLYDVNDDPGLNNNDATGHLSDALGGKNLEPLEEEYTLHYTDHNEED